MFLPTIKGTSDLHLRNDHKKAFQTDPVTLRARGLLARICVTLASRIDDIVPRVDATDLSAHDKQPYQEPQEVVGLYITC